MSKGSLTFPSDPLAAMRELGDLDTPTPVLTEARTYGDTELLTEVRTDGSKSGRKQERADVLTEASEDARKDGRTEGSTGVPPHGRRSARTDRLKSVGRDGLLDVVEAALASREPLIGGVKATVDMSPELSTRAKRYLADHRGQNTRQVLIALFDAFLTAKGY